jgi:hypothetical protein
LKGKYFILYPSTRQNESKTPDPFDLFVAADPVASRRDAVCLPRGRTHTPKALQKLAGGKRSATTGCVAPIALHPEGMPAPLHAVALTGNTL